MRPQRFSIARLMGVVLVAALGLASLRSGSTTLAGLMFLTTCGVLALAVVGVACRGGGERAWWTGFALFGWGYLYLAFQSSMALPAMPTLPLLDALRAGLGTPAAPSGAGSPWWRGIRLSVAPPGQCLYGDGVVDRPYGESAHCLASLLAATLGGVLAFGLFAPAKGPPAEPAIAPGPVGPTSRGRGGRAAWLGPAALALAASAALFGPRSAAGPWAGVALLLTWGLVGVSALVAALGRGRRRAAGLGATLFGAGYLLLIFGSDPNYPESPHIATAVFLDAIRPRLSPFVSRVYAPTDAIAAANERIVRALERPIPMRFPQETPIGDVLKSVVAATRDRDGWGLPIYVDPVGLQEAEKTIASPVSLDLDGIPLRTTLELALKQLGLTYVVKGGLLQIVYSDCCDDIPLAYRDPYLVVGQCLLAWLAAGLGGVAGLLACGRRGEPAEAD